jgi:hypothetical protein
LTSSSIVRRCAEEGVFPLCVLLQAAMLAPLRLHRIAADQAAESIEQANAFDLDWRFLSRLKASGYRAADEWLALYSRHPSAATSGALR